MKEYFGRIKFQFVLLMLMLFFYALCRVLFFYFNKGILINVDYTDVLVAEWYGIPFDLSAIIYLSSLFILVNLLPVGIYKKKWVRVFQKYSFIIPNSLGILANCGDFSYFEFIHKRTTFDVFNLMTTQTSMSELLPLFIKDYWYIFLITIILVVVLIFAYNKLFDKIVIHSFSQEIRSKEFIYKNIAFVFCMGLSVVGMRGGLQLIPIGIINAGDHVESSKIPLVLNTPFSLMASSQLSNLEEKKYFTREVCDSIFQPCSPALQQGQFNKMNVVFLILESFSRDYTGLARKESYTPFLDSLMNESYTFTNAYSNGERSIEGIPAILSSLPSFEYSYLNTPYANNTITSIAKILKSKGYSSSFFHGGNNGTMNFDTYAKQAGFDEYFGRTEYGNDKDYDGSWGIWDEPFLQRYATELSKMKQPFVSSLFTVSSHHPFAVPDQYKEVYKGGGLPIYKTIQYTDHALKMFFDKVKNEQWFDSTLFVITADHTGTFEKWNEAIGFQIPLLFYKHNSSLKAFDSVVVQQVDIMKGVLSYLNYDERIFSFGNNPFDKNSPHFAVRYYGREFLYFYDNTLLRYNEQTVSANKFRIAGQELIAGDKNQKDQIEINRLKALIQQYNYSLINNKLECK